MVWEKGRQLKSTRNAANTIYVAYTYNSNGIRTSKAINGVVYSYTLDGTKIIREDQGESHTLIPMYDNEDSVCGVLYNNTPFYFQKNLQGDVIAIANADGSTVARYSYDAWGKCTVLQDTSGRYIASVNPFRYRSYYYDSEIGMYYLQSRYYDPEIGRFINADEPGFCMIPNKGSGHNLYIYCNNNSVNLSDGTGYEPVTIAILLQIAQFALLCVALLLVFELLTKLVSSSSFQRSWVSFCTAVGNGLAWIGNTVVNGGKSAWDWTINQIQAAITAVMLFTAVVEAAIKIRRTIKRSSKGRYWTATLRSNYVDLGRAITYGQAVREVSAGRNVFTVTCAEAKAVAKAAYSNKKPVGPEIDKGKENVLGYYYHFHVYGRKRKGHVFFLFW